MNYPQRCLRGIANSSENFIYPDGTVTAGVFRFAERDDEWMDLSINWDDDDGSKETLLNQTKENGEIQFKAGYAIILREELDHYKNQPAILGALAYNREPLENNPYHGNILLRNNVPAPKRRIIQGALALIVSEIVLR